MRDLVVIGGSLAGVTTLCQLIDQLPSPFHAPILVVLHAGSEGSGSPANALAGCTRMPVSCAAEGDEVKAGKVYLAPSDRHLLVRSPGVLGLTASAKAYQPGSDVDCLFETAARAYGPRVIGVVLSGGGSNGMKGLQAVNAAGGIGVLQDGSDGLRTGPADGMQPECGSDAHYCLPLDDIAELLRNLIDDDVVTPE